MSAPATHPLPGTIPDLEFAVEAAASLEPAASPTLEFTLRIDAPGGQQIRAILLDIQFQIAARQRAYAPAEQERLLELFGDPGRWGSTLRTLPWVRTTVVVPPFERTTTVPVTVPCTYDLEVAGARYLAALRDGEVPLELLFSGSVFFATPQGALQTTRISWNRETTYRLPVSVWRRAMDRHFHGSAWLRLGAGSYERLCAYKARGAFATWDAAVDALLEEAQA